MTTHTHEEKNINNQFRKTNIAKISFQRSRSSPTTSFPFHHLLSPFILSIFHSSSSLSFVFTYHHLFILAPFTFNVHPRVSRYLTLLGKIYIYRIHPQSFTFPLNIFSSFVLLYRSFLPHFCIALFIHCYP